MCAKYNYTCIDNYYIERSIPELYSIESNSTDTYTIDDILSNYKWIIDSAVQIVLE